MNLRWDILNKRTDGEASGRNRIKNEGPSTPRKDGWLAVTCKCASVSAKKQSRQTLFSNSYTREILATRPLNGGSMPGDTCETQNMAKATISN